MGVWEGLLSGFQGRKQAIEQQNYERSRDATRQESALFSTLLNADDPEIRSLALTGLLDTANPRKAKSGLKGWLGELETSPYLEPMKALLATPVMEDRSTIPSRQSVQGVGLAPSSQPAITEPAGDQPAGMAPTSPVSPTNAGAPPTPVSYTQAPPVPYTVSRPRQAFLAPDERAYRNEMAQVQAEVEGDKMRIAAGMAPRYGVRAGAAAASALREGNVHQAPDGSWVQDLWEPETGKVHATIPAVNPQAAGTAKPPTDEELTAVAMFGYEKPGETPAQTLLRVASGPDGVKRLEQIREKTKAATKAAADDPMALAEMAAKDPTVLQRLTPTLSGAVMNALAKNPQLRGQYEKGRLEPVRTQAGAALTALNDLVQRDANGQIIGLSTGARRLYGLDAWNPVNFLPGTAAATARAALGQVTGQLTLDLIKTMKDQSRTGATGFGQLSAQELGVLEASATMLKGNISEGRALQELKSLDERFGKILMQGAEEQSAGAAGGPPVPGSVIPEELKNAPPGSVWEDAQGVPRWKKDQNGQILPY